MLQYNTVCLGWPSMLKRTELNHVIPESEMLYGSYLTDSFRAEVVACVQLVQATTGLKRPSDLSLVGVLICKLKDLMALNFTKWILCLILGIAMK